MPRNFRQLIRERMERTGESYASAARHIRRKVASKELSVDDLLPADGEVILVETDTGETVEVVFRRPGSLLIGVGDNGLGPESSPLRDDEYVEVRTCACCLEPAPFRCPKTFFGKPFVFPERTVICAPCFEGSEQHSGKLVARLRHVSPQRD